MTSKQYVAETKQRLNQHVNGLTEGRNKKNRFFNIASVVVGALGACVLFSNFWFALPAFGAVAALQMEKKKQLKAFDDSIEATSEQTTFLDKMVQNGIDVSAKANAERKQKMDALEKTRMQQNTEYLSSTTKNHFANMLVAGTTALAWFVGGPVLSLIPLATLLVKNASDNDYVAKHAALEKTGQALNHEIYGYNVSSYVNHNRAVAQQQAAQRQAGNAYSTARTATAQTTRGTHMNQPLQQPRVNQQPARPIQTAKGAPTAKPTYTKEQEAAVNRYLQKLAEQKGQTTPVQKRKV